MSEEIFFSSEALPIETTGFMLYRTPRDIPSNDKCPDQETLRSLFESEETPLLRYAFSLVRRRAVAEEIVQDAFLQLHIKWKDVGSPRAWLYRTVRNKVFNYMLQCGPQARAQVLKRLIRHSWIHVHPEWVQFGSQLFEYVMQSIPHIANA